MIRRLNPDDNFLLHKSSLKLVLHFTTPANQKAEIPFQSSSTRFDVASGKNCSLATQQKAKKVLESKTYPVWPLNYQNFSPKVMTFMNQSLITKTFKPNGDYPLS